MILKRVPFLFHCGHKNITIKHSFSQMRRKKLDLDLLNVQSYSKNAPSENILSILKTRIKMYGPLTVAAYMKEILTNTQSGYYMYRDVFGTDGDFITSPEISQMFGEMIGVWIVNEWMNRYNDRIQIVELGPGRGTLADDMLRVFSQFPNIADKVSLHLVEISPTMSSLQAAKLCEKNEPDNFKTCKSNPGDSTTVTCQYQSTSKYGTQVFWYKELADVPKGLSCFIAHEFLDALPIHKFHKTDKGWREVMVDEDPESGLLRFVLAPAPTPASIAYLKDLPNDERINVEVCPQAGIVVQEISHRIAHDGGFSLLADYGHTGEKGGTFRAFKNHKLHDPLDQPGTADLTADVDFSYLKRCINAKVNVYGPITQERFLNNMGIGYRLQSLLQHTSQEHWSSLISGYKMLTSPEQMGERFKFMSIMPRMEKSYTPAGFASLNLEADKHN
ncbi:protein arginine methyltransferase NDUFAF7, mitochondrial-like [Physella acuta]|uniref:protein arginine methyltransferase NDUFAF7, mitochondrial-like n=1 Tax=Physella acuta TaxID=109671 RepID=UPI0027DE498F|nr:protein arginine methyltransferase NDUFAF7, mitochondrial-like [Physella acuta]XP_059162322.1 protein arginine methyltransferase NDUFAF7, mitochondrial-like [Physella acuta]XP_059162323.1 protein arginine methyltransferase NDUFAF7, mitochondrial-like [Physella acuta]XP_059162324.1 protein arginine methyltransferase NDUFAF7, mitochondrial-like [Physella acuta]XP_059162325.1 protein arginine methyltransferase NDUFAF7, mitochondrial-like [Physella acuta]XP_059162326.1 protein arginine methyltr